MLQSFSQKILSVYIGSFRMVPGVWAEVLDFRRYVLMNPKQNQKRNIGIILAPSDSLVILQGPMFQVSTMPGHAMTPGVLYRRISICINGRGRPHARLGATVQRLHLMEVEPRALLLGHNEIGTARNSVKV